MSKLGGDEDTVVAHGSSSASWNKKRPKKGDDEPKPPSAKRARVEKNVSQASKKTKATRAEARPRASAAKAKQSAAKSASNLQWKVVACPTPSQVSSELKSVDLRPRLWSSSREELMSAYVEISGSKCVNNISWKSTEVPILILDDEFISLEKVQDKDDELCMDVIFWREFRYKVPPPPAEVLTASSEHQEGHGSEANIPQPRAQPITDIVGDIPKAQHPAEIHVEASKEPPLRDNTQRSESVAQQSSSTSNEASVTATAKSQRKAQKQQSAVSDPSIAPLTTSSDKPQGAKRQKKARTVTFSLPIGSEFPSASLPHVQPSVPPAPPPFQSDSVNGHPPRASRAPSKSLSVAHPPSQPQETTSSSVSVPNFSSTSQESWLPQSATPSLPASNIGKVLGNQRNVEATFSHYPDNRSLPESNKSNRNSSQGHRLETPVYPHHHSRELRVIGVGGPSVVVKDEVAEASQLVPKDCSLFSAMGVYCSKMRFVPNCPKCDDVEVSPHSGDQETDEEQLPDSQRMQIVPTRSDISSGASPNVASSLISRDFRDGGTTIMQRVPSSSQAHVSYPLLSRPIGNTARRVDHQWGTVGTFNVVSNLSRELQELSGALIASTRQLTSQSHDVNPSELAPKDTPMIDTTAHLLSGSSEPRPVSIKTSVGLTQKQRERKEGERVLEGREKTLGSEDKGSEGTKKPPKGKRKPPEPVNFNPGSKHSQLGENSNAHATSPISAGVHKLSSVQAATTTSASSNQKAKKGQGKNIEPVNPDGCSKGSRSLESSIINTKVQPAVDTREPGSAQPLPSAPPLKRKIGKGKKKAPEVLGSDDDSPHPVKNPRPPKKQKSGKDPSAEKNGTYPETQPITTPSKVHIEDLHSPAQTSEAAAPISIDSSTPAQEGSLNTSVSAITQPVKPKKPRRRLPQTSKAKESSLCTTQPMSVKTEFDDPSISSASAMTSGSRAEFVPKSKVRAKSTLTEAMHVERGESGVPMPIPDELKALVDAYINCAPVGVFAAGKQIRGFWGLDVAHQGEFGYSFMGFYRVSRVWENLVEVNGAGGTARSDDIITARVQWRFRMNWEPGGEDWQTVENDKLSSPWWNTSLKARGLSVMPQPDMDDSDEESTETYRLARRHNPNFDRRHCVFSQTFFSVLPLHLLAPMHVEMPDSSLPRGWHCQDCGKLNFRYYLRHRRCLSPYCQSKPNQSEGEGYAIELDRMRDPQDNLPLSLPLNELPSRGQVDAKVRVWKDRTKTMVYLFDQRLNEKPVVVQHVFTCNSRVLQKEPSELLRLIQTHVPLRRLTGDGSSNPYFMHSVDAERDRDDTHSSWESAPECLRRARDLMCSNASKYGANPKDINILRLDIRAWVTAGSKRASDLLSAKQRCIVIMCLGCEVIMTISPKSTIAWNDDQARMSDLDKLIPMDDFYSQEDQLEVQLVQPEDSKGAKVETEITPGEPEKSVDPAPPVSTRGSGLKMRKPEKTTLTVSLIHGDIVVLEGDEFEYSIKRTGTSILLIGS